METISCIQVQEWVEAALRSGTVAPPSAALYAHIADCPICSGALLLLVAHAATASPAAASHEQCLNDLAAFIDAEAIDAFQARCDYPHVWWHLWSCTECAETYALTRALLADERQGLFTPEATPVDVVRLPRHFLSQALPKSSPELGAPRGSDDSALVLVEEELSEGRQLVLSAQEHSADAWSMTITVTPPLVGGIVAALGASTYLAPFDTAGHAILPALPATLLTADHGPDLTLTLLATTS